MNNIENIVSPNNLATIISALIIKINNDILNNSNSLKTIIDNEISDNLDIAESYTDTKAISTLGDAKNYTDSLFKAGITSFEFVDKLPIDNINDKAIYFIPKDTPESENIYEEFVYTNSDWEKIGDTTIDLSNYYNIQQIDSKFTLYNATVDQKISDYDKIISAEINDVKVDTSLLMDKATYLSKEYPDYVNKSYLSIKIEGIEDSVSFSYYGKDVDGNIGFHIFPITTRDDFNNFQSTILNATTNTEYFINLTNERSMYDVVCQVYKFVDGSTNITEPLKTYNIDESYDNIYDNQNTTFDSGLQINKNFPLTLTTNSDGLFESEIINKSDYIAIGEIL